MALEPKRFPGSGGSSRQSGSLWIPRGSPISPGVSRSPGESPGSPGRIPQSGSLRIQEEVFYPWSPGAFSPGESGEVPGSKGVPGDPESSRESFSPGAREVPRIRREFRQPGSPRIPGEVLWPGGKGVLWKPQRVSGFPGEVPISPGVPGGESPLSPGLPDPRERGRDSRIPGREGRERGRSRVYSWRALRYIRLSGRRRPSLGCASRVRAARPMPRQGARARCVSRAILARLAQPWAERKKREEKKKERKADEGERRRGRRA